MYNKKMANRALVIAILISLCAGFQYCWSLLGKSIIAEYGWTATQASLPYTVLTIVTSIWAIFAGRIGENRAPRGIIAFGGICMGLGLIISSRTQSPIVMIISVGVLLGLASTSITANTHPTVVKWWPADKKGFVVGACTMGMGLSSLYMAPVINGLLGKVGIINTFMILGIAAIVLICILSALLPISPVAKAHLARKKAERSGQPIQQTAEEIAAAEAAARKMDEEDQNTIYKNTIQGTGALKTKEFWVICLIYIACWMPGQMITSAVANICSVQGHWEGGFVAVMAMAVGNGVGRLCSSTISDKLGVVKTYRVLFILQALNMVLFSFYRTPILLVIGTVILGFIVGSGVPLQIILTAQVYGRKYIGSINGMVQPAFGVAGFAGPVIAAAILDATGTYNMSYIFNAIVLVVGLLLTWMIKEQPKTKTATA